MEHQLFSDRLIKLRMDSNLTQKDLADAIFVSRSAVAKWEQGRGLPDAKTLCEIARYFGISIEKLIEDTELEDSYVPSNKYSDGVMKRIQLCLKSKDFSKAYDLVELVLNNDSSNSKAYLLAVLIEYQFSSIKELRESTVEIQKNVNFLHALQFASEEEKKELLEIEKQIEENTNQLKLQKCYDLGVLYFQKKDYKKAKSYFSLVEDFSHAQEYIQKCEDKLLLEKERHYRYAKRLMRSRLLSKLSEAEKIFTSLNDYKDSQELLAQVQRSKKKCRQQVIFYSSLSSSIAFLCVLFVLLNSFVFVPNRKRYEAYQDAMATYEAENYEEASLEFEKIGNYREAEEYKIYSRIHCELENRNYRKAKELTLTLNEGMIAYRLYYDYYKEPMLREYRTLDYSLPKLEDNNGRRFAEWEDYHYEFDDKTETLWIQSKATFQYIQYKITYELNGGTNHPVNYVTSFNASDDVIVLREASKEDCDFMGWYDNPDFYGEPIEEIVPSKTLKDITLYAKFAWKEYKITYILNGGTNHPDNPSTYTKWDANIPLEDPSYPGHIFLGWLDKKGNPVTFIKTSNKRDYTLTASWTMESIPVNYYVLDGSSWSESWENPNPSTIKYNESFELRAPILPEDKVFLGWFTSVKSLGNVSYEQTTMVDYYNEGREKIDIYAKIINRYKPVYYHHVEEVVNNPNPNQVEYGGNSILLNDLQRDGYTFFGWYSDANLQNSVESISYSSSGNEIHLYAKWGLDVLPINYHIDDQTKNPVENPQVIHYGESLTLQEPTKEGSYFLGWKKDNEGDYITTLSYQEYIEGKEIHLYPIWTTKKCTIEYVVPYGSNHPDNPSIVPFTKSMTLKEPTTDPKYRFVGWKTEEGNIVNEIVYDEQNSKDHYVLTATYDSIGTVLIDYQLVGDGTQSNPFQITNVEQFVYLNRVDKNLTKYFALMNDLDFAGCKFPSYVVNLFTGHLEGNHHTIKNLQVPLFNTIEHANISNLFLSFVQVEQSSAANNVKYGILSNQMYYTTLNHVEMDENCSLTCFLTNQYCDDAYIGMISGMGVWSTIQNCHLFNKIEIMANNVELGYIGGFLGDTYGEIEILDSSLNGKITYYGENSSIQYGGFIGRLQGGCTISNVQLDLLSTLEGKFNGAYSTGIASMFGFAYRFPMKEVVVSDCDINFQANVNNNSEDENITFYGVWGGQTDYFSFSSQQLHIEENFTLSSSHGKDRASFIALGEFERDIEIQIDSTTIVINADVGNRTVTTVDQSAYFTSPSSYQYNINPQNPTA